MAEILTQASRLMDQAETMVGRGVDLAQQKQLDQAIAHFRSAIQIQPDFAKAHHNLGIALAEKGRLDEAVQSIQVALRLAPDYLEAHVNLGNVYQQMGDYERAAVSFREVIRRKPDHVGAANNLGLNLMHLGRIDEAVIWLKHATRVQPTFVEAHNNLGLALTDAGAYDEAISKYEDALRLQPLYAEAHANMGNVFKARAQLIPAITCYDLALSLNPDSVTTRWNRSLALLQSGDYVRGWAEYEVRRMKPNSGIRPFREPMWDGSPLRGRTILIHMEQGFGDMLQFVRYFPLVQQAGGRVVVTCPETLLRLVRRCAGIDHLVSEVDPLPKFDLQVPLLSLPALLGTTLATVPNVVPYLFVDQPLVDSWKAKIAGISGFKVGIVWQGNPKHPWDRHRSIPLSTFAPLAEIAGVRLVSLQTGPERMQCRTDRHRFEVLELRSEEEQASVDFMGTAALMKNLELIITVDTSTAHLAGGLGLPTWVALAQITDWRWLHGRDDSPWYPTLRLFQQKEIGQWEQVFANMKNALAALAIA